MKYIIGNFKMNLECSEITNYINSMKTVKNDNANIIYVPSSIYITKFIENNLNVGIQNISEYKKGAYTGEISASQAKSLGINYSLVGHSERRLMFNDTDEVVNKKVIECLENNIVPVLCIGESLEEKNQDKTMEILKNQIKNALNNIKDINNVIIAYEPIWAIGTGLVPIIDEINDICLNIKNYIKANYEIDLPVLYGGSVNASNSNEILTKESIDGILVGGASIKIEEFTKICENI